jgi:aminomethyltransferase
LKDRKFIGSEAIARRKLDTSLPVRVGLKVSGRRAAREGSAVIDRDQRKVGEVSSGTFSPTLQTPIAMAYVARSIAVAGMQVDVDIRGAQASAEIVPLPFYKRPTA